MGMPSSANARLFYRVARQRREDVELLLNTTGEQPLSIWLVIA